MTKFKSQLNSNHPISESNLTAIIASPDKLKEWNDINEQALNNAPNEQVIKNIRATASLIVLQEKVVSSQNFELMRAMNLFDRTLSGEETAKGVLNGVTNTLLKTIKEKLSPPESESMNLAKAQARSQALADSPSKLASTAYSAAQLAWQNPDIISTTLKQVASKQFELAKTQLAQSMTNDNPSYAVGAVFGTGVTRLTMNALNPAKKMDWEQYENLLGAGTMPPPLKPFRDFSGKMAHSTTESGEHVVTYKPNHRHYIASEIDKESNLSFGIETRVNTHFYGSGTDLFLSTAKVFHQNGVDASKLSDIWEPGRWDTNHGQFLTSLQNGSTLEQAAKQTFTGKMASKLGLTSVDTSQLEKAVAESNFSLLEPVFKHPDWGAGEQMNNYSHKFALAHGRPSLELITPADAVKPLSAMKMELLSTLNSLPEHQQQPVLKHINSQLNSLGTALNNTNLDEIEPK